MWSSGQDPALSPPWPGFDSRHGSQEGRCPGSKQGYRTVQRGSGGPGSPVKRGSRERGSRGPGSKRGLGVRRAGIAGVTRVLGSERGYRDVQRGSGRPG